MTELHDALEYWLYDKASAAGPGPARPGLPNAPLESCAEVFAPSFAELGASFT
jgi:hypothetical protein